MAAFSNLGQYLKKRRLAEGYSQSQLARSLGSLHVQFVSNWERGLCAPPVHSLSRVISVLKLQREKVVEVMVEDSKIAIEHKIYVKKQPRRRKSA